MSLSPYPNHSYKRYRAARNPPYQGYAERGLEADGITHRVLPETPSSDLLKRYYPGHAYNYHNNWRRQATNGTNETIEAEFVQIPIDHADPDGPTYGNRFWVAEAGYKKGGPVFIYDAGEGNAAPNALFRLQNETSFFKQIVDMYGGIGIVWEHRFYGNSSPIGNITLDTPVEKFKTLTAEQALADVPSFASQFQRKNFPDVDFHPSVTPWVFIGGSYPGMRAAFMRKFYPDTIYASFASSAPVQASLDMSFYFEPVYQGLNSYGWGNCTKDVRAAVTTMDDMMAIPAMSAMLKKKFLGRGADDNENAGFADALNTIFYLWQSYGVEGGASGLRSFCDWIGTDPTAGNKTSPAEGWAASKGANYTIDRWASWPAFTDTVNGNMFTNCEGPSPNSTVLSGSGDGNVTKPDCNLNLRFPDPDAVSWTYQYCTQWGFLQYSNVGPHQLISKYNSLGHQLDICQRQFPDGRNSSNFPAEPAIQKTNDHFGGWDIRPSNVYWSGGEFDPWRTLSPLSAEPFAPNISLTQEIPACGVSTSERELFGYTMADAEHAFDFRTTFAGGAVSRKFFTDALTVWLKCFKPALREGYIGLGAGRRQ
ncbi:hypothetical protein K402DRAFT_94821 [Aulographum hederae CBS 113979]|uniref:Peptidase S28 n=1 Tax=Aulographum hederae CBS 113979 TaxID=1176131 RepID=A0A6G1GYM1_9PEZI|nr:hypothetical protein K402DRAFT_94821 [Aulographum hederae CBS 113979]